MQKQKILILGAGGGREHSLGWKISQSPQAGEMFFAKGNPGTAQIGTNLDIKETDFPVLVEFANSRKIDLVCVVSDDLLALGAVDEFRKAGFRVWGPTKAASEIEWSKAFSKDFMERHNLPTAKFKTFTDFEKAKEYVATGEMPIVIKADGLALGKGVVIAQTLSEANEALENMMVKKIFGNSGNEVVIEEFLVGPEISIHALSDGVNYKMFPTSQDHKRVGEGDNGPNTGGMGVIGPLPFVDVEMLNRIEKEIISPTIKAMSNDGIPFEGILYPSLMLTKDGPKIIEFNSRFGDPECQVYMRLLDSDLLEIINSCVDKKLNVQEIKWKKVFACNIAVASGGYPGAYEKGKIITGIGDAEQIENVVVFHAGTTHSTSSGQENNNLVTNGGRVLGISTTGETLEGALKTAYDAVSKISFEGMQYRHDIGKSALEMIK